MADPLVLAVDIGTGGARAVLFDTKGEAVASTRRPIETRRPRAGWAEQDPRAVVDAVAEVIAGTAGEAAEHGSIEALAFSSQMYSILAASRDGDPLTPSLPWIDGRAVAEADDLRARPDAATLAATTGCPAQPIYPLAKIRWLRANAGVRADARFLSIKDFVLWRLTGRLVADRSTASASGLLDVSSGDWSELALDVGGITRAGLPPLGSPYSVAPVESGTRLAELGVPPGTPIVLGAGDAALSSVGSGATSPSILALNLGSSAAARRMVRQPLTDPGGRLWTYIVDDDHWIVGGIIGSAGLAYDWVLDLVLGPLRDEAYQRAEALLRAVPAGAEGLTFLPYVSGEQCPSWRPAARGAFVGIDLGHGRGHLLRASIEGLALALARVRDAIEELEGAKLEEATLTGGLARSETVLQVVADVLGLPVVAPVGHEGSARGAAILARVALGALPDLEMAGRLALAGRPRIQPRAGATATYRHRLQEFVGLAGRIASSTTGTG